MPRPATRLDPSEPLHSFALELRRLRDLAPARSVPGDRDDTPRPWSVEDVASVAGIGSATIYAALSGRRCPSRKTLTAMVTGWAPNGAAEIPAWMERRAQVEETTSANVTMVRRRVLNIRTSEDAQVELLKRLEELRISSDSDTNSIAQATGISIAALSSYLTGDSLPNQQLLVQLAVQMGASDRDIDDLLNLRAMTTTGLIELLHLIQDQRRPKRQ